MNWLVIVIDKGFSSDMKHFVAVVHVVIDLFRDVVPRSKVESAYFTAFKSAGA
jgi:hypothetical protein